MRTPPAGVSAFTVNGARPNSNNVTIDGVANIDTGDNGGNMTTTNIDAVAEFKVLTNAYQAEYGRAVGGQVQVVTKSGSQAFHGSGYWYGRRSDWNANTWLNNRSNTPKPKAEPATTAAIRSAVRSSSPASSTPTSASSSSSGARSSRAATILWRSAWAVCRRRSSARGDFSQSVDSNGNLFPYIRDYQLAQANPTWGCSAADQRACFAGRRRARADPREPALPAGPQRARDLSRLELHREEAASTTPARRRRRIPGAKR